MLFIRKILFLIVFISLSFSGLANASVDCCFKDAGSGQVSMMDEPCHDMKNQTNTKDNDCQNCGCQHCVSSIFILPQIKEIKLKSSIISFSTIDDFASKSLDKSLRPPKNIS